MRLADLILSNNIGTSKRLLILFGLAWLPLVVLTLIDGTFISSDITMPFIKDVVPFVKTLIVIPLLVMTDNLIEPMMARVLSYLRTSGIVTESDQDNLRTAAEKMATMINLKRVEFILIALVLAVSWFTQKDYSDMWHHMNVTSWALHQENGTVDETMAGLWFLLISSPLVSFLVYRWVWRFIVWSIFLFRVSRFNLKLYPSHTDHAAGLAVIGQNQILFGILFLVMASILSAELADNIIYEGDKLVDLKMTILVFIIICVAVITGPLLFFTKKLLDLKHRALVEYSALQQQISGDFHKAWIDDKSKGLVDSMHPSAMADYSAVFEVVSDMLVVPLKPKSLVYLAGMLLLPFLPLALTVSPITEILQKIGSSLI